MRSPVVKLSGAEVAAVTELGGRRTLEVYVDVIDQFIQHQRYRCLSPNTIRRRHETLRQFARYLQPLPLERATSEHVEEFIGLKAAARTRHAYRSDLRVFYAWALHRELVDSDPTLGLATIRVPKALPRPLDPEVAARALQVGSKRHRRMVGLALYAGLRCHEIAGLHAEDVWSHVDPPILVVRHGKGGKDRSVNMHPALVELLSPLPSSGPVFPGRGIPTIRAESVSQAIRAHLLSAGIDGTAHQLRHTFGTGLARASGGDMVLTAEMMGHESMTTTMGYVRLAHSGAANIIGRLYQPDDAA